MPWFTQLIFILCFFFPFAVFIYCKVEAVSKIILRGGFSFSFRNFFFPPLSTLSLGQYASLTAKLVTAANPERLMVYCSEPRLLPLRPEHGAVWALWSLSCGSSHQSPSGDRNHPILWLVRLQVPSGLYSNMTGVLIRRHTNTDSEDGHVTMEAGVELLQQAVMNHPKLPENHQKLARVEEGSPLHETSETAQPSRHLDFRLWTPELGDNIFLLL